MEPRYVLKHFQAGDIIIHEGERSGRIYILKSGVLEVIKDGVIISEISEQGSIIGEMSSLLEGKRTATVRARVDSELYLVDHELSEIVEKYPNITVKILITLADRLVDLEKRYCQLAEEKEKLEKELEKQSG